MDSLEPRRLVTSSSRQEDDDDSRGDAGERFHDHGGCGAMRGGFGDDEIFPGEEDERAEDENFIDKRIDDPANCAFDFPAPGEKTVEEVGDQGDQIDMNGGIQEPGVASAFILVVGQHDEEDHASTRRRPVRRLGTWRNIGFVFYAQYSIAARGCLFGFMR